MCLKPQFLVLKTETEKKNWIFLSSEMDKLRNFFYEGEIGKWIAPCKSDKALLFEAVSAGNRRQYEEMKARGKEDDVFDVFFSFLR